MGIGPVRRSRAAGHPRRRRLRLAGVRRIRAVIRPGRHPRKGVDVRVGRHLRKVEVVRRGHHPAGKAAAVHQDRRPDKEADILLEAATRGRQRRPDRAIKARITDASPMRPVHSLQTA